MRRCMKIERSKDSLPRPNCLTTNFNSLFIFRMSMSHNVQTSTSQLAKIDVTNANINISLSSYKNFHLFPLHNTESNKPAEDNSLQLIKGEQKDEKHDKNTLKNNSSKYGFKISLNNFYFREKKSLRRKVLADQSEDNDINNGFSLDEAENTTIISFMRFDKGDKMKHDSKSELVTNWNWDNVNNSAYVIDDGDGMSMIKSETKRSPLNNIVSKNITMLLENLLKNYENSQLPTHGQGRRTKIKYICDCFIACCY